MLQETECQKRDGSIIYIETSAALVGNGKEKMILSIIRDITRRKKLENRFGSILKNVSDAIVEIDLEGTILYINRTLSGRPVNDIIATNIYDYVPPPTQDEMRNQIHICVETKSIVIFETKTDLLEHPIWLRNKAHPILTDNKVTSIVLISTDITKEKEAQRQLQEMHDHLNIIIESMPGYFMVLDLDFNIIKSNKKIQRLMEGQSKCYEIIDH